MMLQLVGCGRCISVLYPVRNLWCTNSSVYNQSEGNHKSSYLLVIFIVSLSVVVYPVGHVVYQPVCLSPVQR